MFFVLEQTLYIHMYLFNRFESLFTKDIHNLTSYKKLLLCLTSAQTLLWISMDPCYEM